MEIPLPVDKLSFGSSEEHADSKTLIRSSPVRTICRDFVVICIRREGTDIEKIIASDEILSKNKVLSWNIISVDEREPNQISSSKVRNCIRRGLTVKYLTSDEVINDYIRDHKLYVQQNALLMHESK